MARMRVGFRVRMSNECRVRVRSEDERPGLEGDKEGALSYIGR